MFINCERIQCSFVFSTRLVGINSWLVREFLENAECKIHEIHQIHPKRKIISGLTVKRDAENFCADDESFLRHAW